MRAKVRVAIASMVTMIWAASYITSLINHNYHPPAEINAIMLLVAGFFFSSIGTKKEGGE